MLFVFFFFFFFFHCGPCSSPFFLFFSVCKLSTTTGVPLFCGFNRRSDAQFLDLKKRVEQVSKFFGVSFFKKNLQGRARTHHGTKCV
jgi:hypothetical protein